jgi:pimeloyl-ACP methyl ester carboxylesterase
VVAGELDPFNPPSLAAEIVEAIPDHLARMVVVPDSAHRVFADNPDFVYDMIRPGLLH